MKNNLDEWYKNLSFIAPTNHWRVTKEELEALLQARDKELLEEIEKLKKGDHDNVVTAIDTVFTRYAQDQALDEVLSIIRGGE